MIETFIAQVVWRVEGPLAEVEFLELGDLPVQAGDQMMRKKRKHEVEYDHNHNNNNNNIFQLISL